ncbi:MAG TPA: hypothetical protein VFY89_02090 [Ktedonobacterales bacterium]
MKYSFLSRWTVLLLTVVAVGLGFLGIGQAFGSAFGVSFAQNVALGIGSIVLGGLCYLFAWVVALLDSIQEKRWGWTILLLLLSVVLIGPLLYSLIGPKNTK